MVAKPVLVPGPDHPISIEATDGRVVVNAAGQIVADTTAGVTVREADYPPVYYIPRADIDMGRLERTKHVTYCPYKGKCNYFSIPGGGERATNAAWTYEAPHEAVAQSRITLPSTAIASTALSARTAEQLPDNTPRTTEEHSVTFVMLALERRPFGRRFGAMEMVSDHRRPVLQADLPLRTKLVLLPPRACEQEAADKNTPVDVPAPTITYPVAHRQSS